MLRFEIILINPSHRIQLIVLTVLTASLLISRLNNLFVFTVPLALGLYLECRFLIDNHDAIYFFVGAFTAPFIPVISMIIGNISGEGAMLKRQ